MSIHSVISSASVKPRDEWSFFSTLSALLFILASVVSAVADNSLPRVPAPAGFIDGAVLSERIKAMGLAGQPASVKLLGLYYQTNTLADILNQGFSVPAPFCKALVKSEYSTVAGAKEAFQALVKASKKEGEKRFDPDDPAIKLLFKHSEDAARKIGSGVSVKPIGISFLGITLDKDTVHAGCMLVNLQWSEDQSTVDMPFAMSFAFTRLGNRRVDFTVLYPFRDSTSVASANKKLLEWIGEVEKQNPEK